MPGPLTIGSGDATHGARGVLPRQGALNDIDYSLQRDTDARWALGGGLEALLGQGVISGCNVRDNGGASVVIPNGARFFLGGAALSLDADQVYNGLSDNAVTTIWATIARTEAAQTNQTASDSWALSVTSNTSDLAPDLFWFRLARVTMKNAAQVAWDNAPPGKFVALADWLQRGYRVLPAGEGAYIAANQQQSFQGSMTVNGCLRVDGSLYVVGG